MKKIKSFCIILIILISISVTSFATLLGDTDLDGEITINDLAKLKLHLINMQTLEGENLKAGDLDGNNEVSINDLAKLKLILIGIDEAQITVEDTAFKGFSFEQQVPEEKRVTFERILMQNKKQVEYGIKGAGSQWPTSLETSSTGDLMLYGIDVAGLYKSTDHGKTWTLACNGFGSRGVGMFAIDPHNSNHVLAVGLGTCGGIYVSYDKAETWAKYSDQSLSYYGARYVWDGLEFDPTSYDKDENLTLDAYYSIPYKRDSEIRTSTENPSKNYSSLEENEVGLYKSTDGGKTFELIINDEKLADGIVRITENGDVYVGNQYGLFLIDKENNKIKASYLENDGEKDFAKGVTGLDVVQNTIYAQTWDGIYTLNGEELTKITNENYKSENWPQFLTVSKSNPNHLIYQYRSSVTNYYVNNTVVSFDGGKTWKARKCKFGYYIL